MAKKRGRPRGTKIKASPATPPPKPKPPMKTIKQFRAELEDDPDFNDDIPLEPKQVFSEVVPNHEQAWACGKS